MLTSEKSQCGSDMECDNRVVIENMIRKEQTIYAQHDYFARSSPISPATTNCGSMPVDEACRNIMAKWCISLCKFCSYDRRMVVSIMSCVDRFVATPKGSRILLDRDEYQLAVMASLYLVAKVQQTQALEPDSIAKLSRGKYTKADIETMELNILTNLKWFVHPPTPMEFVFEFMRDFNFKKFGVTHDDFLGENEDDESKSTSSTITIEERIMDLVNCQIEQAVCDYELSCLTRPSHVAFGAFSNALQSLGIDSFDFDPMRLLKDQLQISDDDYSICSSTRKVSEALLRVVSSSESSNTQLSSLLLHRCNENSKTHSDESDTDPFFAKRSSSSIQSSPRSVAEGIIC